VSATDGTQSLTRVVRAGLDKLERNLHTAQPGIVVSYDASTQTADVRPAVRRTLPSASDEDRDVYEQLPVCPHVPVMWPRGRGFSCVGTLSPGDSVLLVFCERDFSDWYDSGAVSDPQFAELHALNGAVAIPGLTPRTNPIPVPSDAAALASKLDLLIIALKAAVVVAGDGGAALKAAVVAAFPAITGSPAPAVGVITTGSTVLKLGS
jgi:hypothetical protein